MPEKKFKDSELLALIKSGKTFSQCARKFGVSPAAITRRWQKLNPELVAESTPMVHTTQRAKSLVNQGLSARDQLIEINNRALKMLEDSEDDPNLHLRVMNEIRCQLQLQHQILTTFYEFKQIEDFQETVMDAFKEIAPDVQKKIREAIRRRLADRGLFKPPGF